MRNSDLSILDAGGYLSEREVRGATVCEGQFFSFHDFEKNADVGEFGPIRQLKHGFENAPGS